MPIQEHRATEDQQHSDSSLESFYRHSYRNAGTSTRVRTHVLEYVLSVSTRQGELASLVVVVVVVVRLVSDIAGQSG